MTEKEWLECIAPEDMLNFFWKLKDRKFRLFACACCRRIWDLIESDLHRRAVDVAERFADGAGANVEWEKEESTRPWDGTKCFAYYLLDKRPTEKEAPEWAIMLRSLEEWRNNLPEDMYHFNYDNINPEDAAEWTLSLRYEVPWVVAASSAHLRSAPCAYWRELRTPVLTAEEQVSWDSRRQQEMVCQCALLRDIFGNPFRPVSVDASWLAGPVITLADTIYTDRAFDRLPLLADALEEAGCTDADILAHCRGDGPHVRGCWVVDLILGKS
jgi:hypothetical protein